MKNSIFIGAFLVAVLTIVAGAPQEDLVSDLPGLTFKPNFKHYSGYLRGEGTKRLHYWFVESSNNPEKDAVVLWMNGGPGCSSLDGMLSEHGPFRVSPDGKSITQNMFAWNLVSNMIYLEAPAGVGFSFSKDKNYTTDDDEVARNNHLALKDFFSKFPEYKNNDFYITGESYGGIYVPTLSSLVMDDKDIKFKGFAVGNGLSSYKLNDNSIVYFAYYHGLIGEGTWYDILHHCCPDKDTSNCDFFAGMQKHESCAKVLQQIQALVWAGGLNVYNLYSECAGGVGENRNPTLSYDSKMGKYVTSNFGYPLMSLKGPASKLREKALSLPADQLKSSPPCTDSTAMTTYLNAPETRKALHIADEVQEWEICSSVVGTGYKRLYQTMESQYRKAIDRKVRVLVYNGDIDMACNFLGDEWFVDSLHVDNPQERKEWYYKAADKTKQVAGFVKAFDRVTFVTIRGAGHMVPSDKPRPALEMFINFIQNKPF